MSYRLTIKHNKAVIYGLPLLHRATEHTVRIDQDTPSLHLDVHETSSDFRSKHTTSITPQISLSCTHQAVLPRIYQAKRHSTPVLMRREILHSPTYREHSSHLTCPHIYPCFCIGSPTMHISSQPSLLGKLLHLLQAVGKQRSGAICIEQRCRGLCFPWSCWVDRGAA